jgi:hypothetical protein
MKKQRSGKRAAAGQAIFDVLRKCTTCTWNRWTVTKVAHEWQASIGFTGVLNGRFEARFSSEIATAMVENSLVLDGDKSDGRPCGRLPQGERQYDLRQLSQAG